MSLMVLVSEGLTAAQTVQVERQPILTDPLHLVCLGATGRLRTPRRPCQSWRKAGHQRDPTPGSPPAGGERLGKSRALSCSVLVERSQALAAGGSESLLLLLVSPAVCEEPGVSGPSPRSVYPRGVGCFGVAALCSTLPFSEGEGSGVKCFPSPRARASWREVSGVVPVHHSSSGRPRTQR